MGEVPSTIKAVGIAFYTWIAGVFFGAILIDTVYARLVPQETAAFAEVSDLLLPVGLLALLAAIVAIVLAWKSSSARLWLLASLAVLLFEFLIPMLLPELRNSAGTSGLALLRITINAAVSVFAVIGLVAFLRGK